MHISIYSVVLVLVSLLVSVSVSVSAKTKVFFHFLYWVWPKRKMAVSASFGFGRNEKKSFGRTLIYVNISVDMATLSMKIITKQYFFFNSLIPGLIY